MLCHEFARATVAKYRHTFSFNATQFLLQVKFFFSILPNLQIQNDQSLVALLGKL